MQQNYIFKSSVNARLELYGRMMEQADMTDLESVAEKCEGSNPFSSTYHLYTGGKISNRSLFPAPLTGQ